MQSMLHRLSPPSGYTPLKYVFFLLSFHSYLLLFILLYHLISPALLNIAEDIIDSHRIHYLKEVKDQKGHEIGDQGGTHEVA
jgi:hypothetical protein